jgi:NAD(P)-dependent dehydrogenase (short-subunit alcohol dehydrogenase family)
VLAGARDRQRGAEAARELGTAFIHIDPTDDSSVEAAAARVRSEYGHLDVLINNAGTAAPRVGAEELTADAAMEGFAINVLRPHPGDARLPAAAARSPASAHRQRLQRGRIVSPHSRTRLGRERGDPAGLPGHQGGAHHADGAVRASAALASW